MSIANRLSALFRPVTAERASYKVYARATYYPDLVRVYIPKVPYSKLLPGMVVTKKLIRTKIESGAYPEEDLERSLRRTKKTVRDYVLSNQFELFATFTFKDDRQNVEKSKAKMSYWIKNQQRRTGKFEYLIVPEYHKDQKSLHFHALIKNYAGNLETAINPKTGQVLKGKYTFPNYRSGFTSVSRIIDTPESHAKIGNYVRKYITKDMPLFFGKNRYWASSGLKLPVTEDNPQDWYLRTKPVREFSNEHGQFLDFLREARNG